MAEKPKNNHIFDIYDTCRSKPCNSKCTKAKGEIEIIVEKLLYYRNHLKEDCGKLKLTPESPGESMKVLVTQSGLTLGDSTDYSPPGSSVHWNSPGNSTGMGSLALLQGIFPTQGSNLGLSHCIQILDHLSHQEALK